MSETQDSTRYRFIRDGANVIDTKMNRRIVAGFNHKLQASDACAILNGNPALAADYQWEDAK